MPSSRKGQAKEDRIKIGRSYEERAAQFYLDRHYVILHRNYHAGHKEIDLIVQKGDVVVFVEVKSARSKSLGHPAERVTKKKRNNLILAAQQFLIEKNITENDLRFDVVTFLGGKIEHYPSAFGAFEDD
jgi:putative endonuclease